jgi:hypothetical protein
MLPKPLRKRDPEAPVEAEYTELDQDPDRSRAAERAARKAENAGG